MAAGSALPTLLSVATERDLLQILVCPVCQDVMSAPVYMCATGHSICNICKPRLTECPLCKKTLSDVRNFLAEQIISSSVYECIYKVDGCQDTAKGELIQEHIKACEFRTRACPLHLFNDCNESVKSTDVLHHLKSKHNLYEKSSISGRAEMRYNLDEYLHSGPKICPHFYILACYGKKFLVCMLSSQYHLHWGILLIGNEAEEGRYSGEITVELERKRSVRWTFPIVSTFERSVMNYILEEYGCTGEYTKQNIRHQCSTHSQLKVGFKIVIEKMSSSGEPSKPKPISNPNEQKWTCVLCQNVNSGPERNCGQCCVKSRVGINH